MQGQGGGFWWTCGLRSHLRGATESHWRETSDQWNHSHNLLLCISSESFIVSALAFRLMMDSELICTWREGTSTFIICTRLSGCLNTVVWNRLFLAHRTGQNDGATEYEAGVYLCHIWGGTCAHRLITGKSMRSPGVFFFLHS